jgi:hypothetical protein
MSNPDPKSIMQQYAHFLFCQWGILVLMNLLIDIL